MIGYNRAKNGPDMGIAAPRAPVGGWGPRPSEKFSHGSQCYIEVPYL